MDWQLYAVVACGVVLFLVLRWRARRRAGSLLVSPPAAETREIAVRRPALPPGRAGEIVANLQSGAVPDETWMGSLGESAGGVRLLPFSACYQSITGESFGNPDGISRQSILRRARLGSEVYLIPEPTNAHDPDAIAVYLDLGRGATGQIGYLPKGNGLKGDVAAGKVVSWLAKVSASGSGAPLGAVLYVVTAND